MYATDISCVDVDPCAPDFAISEEFPYDRDGVHVQLKALGPQDENIVINPEFTFFKTSWQTYNHFGSETREYYFDKDNQFSQSAPSALFGKPLSTRLEVIPSCLLKSPVLEVTLPPLVQKLRGSSIVAWVRSVVFAMIDVIEFVVNGSVIQSMSGKYIDILNEVSYQSGKQRGYEEMTGKTRVHDGKTPKTYWLPLPFWFMDVGFPLTSLHPSTIVEIRLRLKSWSSCVRSDRILSEPIDNQYKTCQIKLLCEYIYLSNEEGLSFMRQQTDHLIEQVQEQTEFIDPGVDEMKIPLMALRSTKSLYWVLQDENDHSENSLLGNHVTSYTGWDQRFIENQGNLIPRLLLAAQLYLGNEPREPLSFCETSIQRVDSRFYSIIEHYKKSRSVPQSAHEPIFAYHFALDPHNLQPSGHYDFSQTNNFLNIIVNKSLTRRVRITMFSVSYNVMRIRDRQIDVLYVD